MSKLNKKIKEKFENFFDWIKGAELVELDSCNVKEDPIRPELDIKFLNLIKKLKKNLKIFLIG